MWWRFKRRVHEKRYSEPPLRQSLLQEDAPRLPHARELCGVQDGSRYVPKGREGRSDKITPGSFDFGEFSHRRGGFRHVLP